MDKMILLYNKKYNAKMNKSTLSRYENGKQEPIYTVVANLADFFGIPTDYLLNDETTSNKEISTHQSITIDTEYTDLYNKLDVEDKAEIRGEIKQMLKADKYKNNSNNVIPLTPRKIAAYGADGTKQINPPKNPRKIT